SERPFGERLEAAERLRQIGPTEAEPEVVARVLEQRALSQQEHLRLHATRGPIVDPDARNGQPREPDRASAGPEPGEPIGPVVEEGVDQLEVGGDDAARASEPPALAAQGG